MRNNASQRLILQRSQRSTDIPPFSHCLLDTSSDGLNWSGLRLEVGHSPAPGMDILDLMVDGHYISMNLAATTLHFEMRDELCWTPTCLAPMKFWVNPEGRPFSLRHSGDSHWVSCLIDGSFLDEVGGRHYELQAVSGLDDDMLTHLLLSLIALIECRERYTRAMADELIRTFVYALATRHGKPAADISRKGGIDPDQLSSLLSWIDYAFAEPITVESMAERTGLSAAHFSREFKRSTGQSPWGYVVQRRLQAARKLLEAGESVVTAAVSCGFADQPHLSRLFKQQFGVSPSMVKSASHVRTHPVE